ncbi:MAG: phosphonoacetaldehyde hydrolase [bacterium]|nr:phosphonoacetaldehyde hydrolase [bacterium]
MQQPLTLQAVILDWAGTTVDYGSRAPTQVFIEVFAQHGIQITADEARGPMGLFKRDHIRQITQLPRVKEQWQSVHHRLPDEEDAQNIYMDFTPRQLEVIVQYADLIPGVRDTVEAYRESGLKIGSCTGYTRSMMAVLLPEATRQRYHPDSLVCPEDVGGGRPAPWMIWQNAIKLQVSTASAMVKIGDTVADIDEGRNAGTWTVALAKTGNELGLSEAEVDALAPDDVAARLNAIYEKLYAAGAHYVVDSLADTLPVLDDINARLAAGERP